MTGLDALIKRWRDSALKDRDSEHASLRGFSKALDVAANQLERRLAEQQETPHYKTDDPLKRPIVENTDPHRQAANLWFKARGYVPTGAGMWGIAWSKRSGYDFTDLEFYPLHRWLGDIGWDAIIGQHASGENPRQIIGTCENLGDIIRTHQAIRLINGYKEPEPDQQFAALREDDPQ